MFVLDGTAAGTASCTFDNSDGSFSRPGVAYQQLSCDAPATLYVVVDANKLDWAEPLPVRHAPLSERPEGCP